MIVPRSRAGRTASGSLARRPYETAPLLERGAVETLIAMARQAEQSLQQDKQFNRARDWAEDRQLIAVHKIGNITYLRLSRPSPESDDEAE